ncbi:MAG TPA: type II secretion system minor pseudopilin GspJ [Dongiaceae bacterium]|nr:type II secretion system minor pseudopilin GspJ [Dongiaceae bacterium]
MRNRMSGLTLIELLIAMSIFAVMAVSMFIAFDNVQTAKEVTDQSSERLRQYQSAFNRIGQDLQQLAPRPVRDEYGDPLYAMHREDDGSLAFTRAGWTRSAFFSKHPRSNLQRVQYYLEDGKLMRAYWNGLDVGPNDKPTRTELLDGVSELKFQFYYTDYTNPEEPLPKTIEQWPPPEILPSSPPTMSFLLEPAFIILPDAIEIGLTTDDLGAITRSYLVAGGAEQVFK